jgi:hypothetical protein
MEHDGLKPPLKFSHSEFRINKRFNTEEARAIHKDAEGKEYASWVIWEQMVKRKKNDFILDPLFWQALGKALGWKTAIPYCRACGRKYFDELGGDNYETWVCDVHGDAAGYCELWLYSALRYHELNLTGGDTEQFFKDLLKQQQ